MKDVHVTIDLSRDVSVPPGRFDATRVDAMTDDQIEQQAIVDDLAAMKEMGIHVRRIRERLGISQRSE